LVPIFPYIDKYYKISYICNKTCLLEGNHVIESKAISILETYDGPNNYIQDLKRKLTLNKKFYPTRSQSEYIINFHDKPPKVAKKIGG